MRWTLPFLSACYALLAGTAFADVRAAGPSPCQPRTFYEAPYMVCSINLSDYQVSLHWRDADGELIGQPTRLEQVLAGAGREMVVATNGGMYHADRTPVGAFVADGEAERPLVRGDGPGNFQLLPNGVFYIADGVAGVLETEAYAGSGLTPELATQSGPMLVLDGALHPAFRANSDSIYRRAGVGVSEDGRELWLVVSDAPVNLHAFASVFLEELGARNALYLDGKVARMDVPGLGRREFGFAMGPILAVSRRIEDS
jgi:uncharacterized protein YigE (DUF2233 family)